MRRLSRFEWACLGVVAAAFLVRLSFLAAPAIVWDSAWFLTLARSFGQTGTFLLPWSDPAAPQYSGYWPPLYPIFLSPLVALFGASYRTLLLGADLAAALLVVAVFFTTRDLFDRPRAFAAAALIAASPAFYVSDAQGMSESLLGLMVTLTLWAFVKSLARPAWLPVAAAFAFLAYLGKATLGLPIVAIGLAALLAWRVRTRGLAKLLKSPADLVVAAGGLVILVALALTRSGRVGGLGLGLISPLKNGILDADCGALLGFGGVGAHCWAIAFPLKLAFAAGFLFVVALPLSLRLVEALRAQRSERTDAIWLAVLLPLVAGAIFTTTFFFTEKRTFVDFDNIRYLTPAVVPFVWALLPFWRFEDETDAQDARVRRRHALWYWSAVALVVLALLFSPVAGSSSFGRLFAFVLLCLVPVAVSLAARATRYEVAQRTTGGVTERRFVRAKQTKGDGPILAVAAAVLLVGGWFYSTWFAGVGFGLLVALSTTSPARRVVAMSLVLLASAAPGVATPLPFDAMTHALEKLPDGTLVGMNELIVYPAAAAPPNVKPRLVDPDQPIPADINVLVLQRTDAPVDNFTKVASWNYSFLFTPTLAARIWIEERVLGEQFLFDASTGLTVYVRNGTGLEREVQA